jgi:hypothetical protein
VTRCHLEKVSRYCFWLLKTPDLNLQRVEKLKGAGVGNWWLCITIWRNSPK